MKFFFYVFCVNFYLLHAYEGLNKYCIASTINKSDYMKTVENFLQKARKELNSINAFLVRLHIHHWINETLLDQSVNHIQNYI